MGSIRLETVTDFEKHGFDLEVFCRACGHKVILTPDQLAACGVLGSVRSLEKRFKCEKCRQKCAVVIPTAAGPSRGKRRARTWKDNLGYQFRETPTDEQ